ncbi:hypothetical protein YSA_00887 [Pseudomonas putida ND6]|uniref:Uncharacterized protein n=1 Tax=Pseudomonas putida ND6 TaxID=231023 RepID=I3UP35_PSEPU|nr:hypothetical protein YSA_00887 [Pseudomonas putida ND6]
MSQRYRFPSGKLAPGLMLPTKIEGRLRLHLASIEAADIPVTA